MTAALYLNVWDVKLLLFNTSDINVSQKVILENGNEPYYYLNWNNIIKGSYGKIDVLFSSIIVWEVTYTFVKVTVTSWRNTRAIMGVRVEVYNVFITYWYYY